MWYANNLRQDRDILPQYCEAVAPELATTSPTMATILGCADNDLGALRRQCFYLALTPSNSKPSLNLMNLTGSSISLPMNAAGSIAWRAAFDGIQGRCVNRARRRDCAPTLVNLDCANTPLGPKKVRTATRVAGIRSRFPVLLETQSGVFNLPSATKIRACSRIKNRSCCGSTSWMPRPSQHRFRENALPKSPDKTPCEDGRDATKDTATIPESPRTPR
jgi:hypothetical protein